MILCVTMNPSVDISYHLDGFQFDYANRVDKVIKAAGGKGLHVALVAHLLGSEVIATGILGGTTGTFIENQLKEWGINFDFLRIDKETRNCIAILHDGMQTEILEPGPVIDEIEKDAFLERFSRLLECADVAAISGSLPRGLDASVYSDMVDQARSKQIPVLLDCNGSILKRVLEYGREKPNAIKPNVHELNQLLSTDLKADDLEGIKQALSGSTLLEGIDWILVTLGAKGALLKQGGHFTFAKIPKVKAVNPVGSGDSVIAGVAHGIEKRKTAEEVLKIGMTAGVLNAMEYQSGYINMKHFPKIYSKVELVQF